MKKMLLWLLTLVLVLACASAMAAIRIPEEVLSYIGPALQRPAEPADVDVTFDGTELQVHIDDDREVGFVNVFGGEFYAAITPDQEGNLLYQLQPGESLDPANLTVDIYFDTPAGDNVRYDIIEGGKPAVTEYWTMATPGQPGGSWDANGKLDRITALFFDESGAASIDYSSDGALENISISASGAQANFHPDGTLQHADLEVDGTWYHYNASLDLWYIDGVEKRSEGPVDPEYFDMLESVLIRLLEDPEPEGDMGEDVVWHPNNSVCAAGLSVRDDLKISDLWYNIVPIDLTQEGTQELYLIAGNRHHIGKAYVTVKDGAVTVEYKLHGGHGYIKSECLQWFTNLDQITAEYLENPTGEYAYGQPVSIADDLGGAQVGLLFIRNTATYRDPYTNAGGELSRYWRNRDRWVEWRDDLNALLAK